MQMNSLEIWNKKVLTKDLIYKKIYRNVFQLPRLTDICLKMNNKKTVQNSQNIFFSVAVLKILTNQKPKICYAKKSIANFKVQKKMPLSCILTLRKQRKISFLQFFLFFIYPKIQLDIIKNKNSFNVGIKNLLFIPQLTIIHSYNLNEYGFSIAFNFNSEDFELLLSGFQINKKYEETKN